jgi:hypothetical protein
MVWEHVDRDAIVVLDSTGDELRTIATGQEPEVSPDGKTLVVVRVGEAGSLDVFAGPFGRDEMRVLVGTEADESQPRISPDGRLIAYSASESDEAEVFVDTFPTPTGRQQISAGGGHTPRWGGGSTLHYISDGRMMAAEIRQDSVALVGPPVALFSLVEAGLSTIRDGFDVDSAGRFLMLRSTPRPGGPALVTIVTGAESLLQQPR